MENFTFIIDRIENNIAICELENKKFININIKELPQNIKEGSILYKKNGKYFIENKKEISRKSQISKKFKDLCE